MDGGTIVPETNGKINVSQSRKEKVQMDAP